MEIERKYLISPDCPKVQPKELSQYSYHEIEQGYLSTDPVVRVRKQDDTYYLTYKGSGMMVREEYNLPLTQESYQHLIQKADGNIIKKRRYLIPFQSYQIELDVFSKPFSFYLAEVEFPSKEEADAFLPPDWFGEDVTFSKKYHNSYLSQVTSP